MLTILSSDTYGYEVSPPCDTGRMTGFSSRLKEARELKGVSQEVVARACDVTRNAVSLWENGKAAPTLDKIEPIAETLDIDPVWLLRGKHGQRSDKVITTPYATVQVMEYHTRLSAGAGSFTTDENKKQVWTFSRQYLADELHLPLNRLAILEVSGDSMEPTLRSGDRVMFNMNDKRLSQPGLFVIFDYDGPSVKRLELVTGTKPQKVTIISDNQQLHRPVTLDAKDVNIVGRVVWFARRA